MSKLDFPYNAIIPYAVQVDTELSASQKIFFGQIVGLSVKYGYIFATDAQLAEMVGAPERTIKYWLQNLEAHGHIKRVTKNYAKTSEERTIFIRKRKIFIVDKNNQKIIEEECREAEKQEYGTPKKQQDSNKDCGRATNCTVEKTIEKVVEKTGKNDSNKDCGRATNCTSDGRATNCTSDGRATNCPYKRTILKETLEKQQHEEDDVVVVFSDQDSEKASLLRNYGMNVELIKSFLELSLQRITDAIEAMEQYRAKQAVNGVVVSNVIGLLRTALMFSWKPNAQNKKKIDVEEEKNKQSEIKIEENATIVNKMIGENKNLFNDEFEFYCKTNICWIKNEGSFLPLSLSCDQTMDILQYYIDKNTK